MSILAEAPLGKKTPYISQYQRDLLFPIPRITNRTQLGISDGPLPFKGVDIWNVYELSWLNLKGKPEVALGEIIFPCTSPHLIEAKSLKLYLNTFNNTSFSSISEVIEVMQRDLSEVAGLDVKVQITSLDQFKHQTTKSFSGTCLDTLDIACDTYQIHPGFLVADGPIVSETVYSNLLKSNCLITGQPDWGSIQIHYTGHQLNHEGLLKYIISYRNQAEFGEPCVERIFMDIMRHAAPQTLTVYARFTRRGGKDINPFRTTEDTLPENFRLGRQ